MGKSWFSKLGDLLSGTSLPHHVDGKLLSNLPLLAIDLELTSLDTQKAKVTSIGWISGLNGNIDMSSSYYNVIRAKGDLAQSPVIHGLTASSLANGCHLKEALNTLATFASSHIWLFHNASLDMAILRTAFIANGLSLPTIVTIDTLKLAIYQFEKTNQIVPTGGATLSACRHRLGLPNVPAHNALDDALATLQLWFAQCHQMDNTGNLTINDLLHTKSINTVEIQ